MALSPSSRMLVERSIPDQAGNMRDASQKQSMRKTRSVTVNLAESPLGWLMARGMISERQFLAGERLRADWTLSDLPPRVTMRWDPAPTGKRYARPPEQLDPTLSQMAAKQRFNAALAHLGQGLSDIAWRVICAGEGLAAAETGLGWPKRAGKLVLSFALDRIADYYRIS